MKTEIVKGFKDYIGEEAKKRKKIIEVITETEYIWSLFPRYFDGRRMLY